MNTVREEDIRRIISKIPYTMCEGKTFLITGANGFLASYMVDTLLYLKKNGYIKKCSVIALCRNKKKAECIFREWLSDEAFHLLIQPVEKEIVYNGKLDYVVHAASCSTTNLFESHPADVINANLIGSYHLLELAREKNVSGFLFFSSGAVYGDAAVEEIREEETYAIDYLNSGNSYAVGKRAGEALCSAYWKQYRVPIRCVRISHTYGPGIDLEDGHVYSDFARNIIARKDIVIKGDGLACRPFCYVSDAVWAFYLLLLCGEDGEMYNMANSEMHVTIKELADLLTREAFSERNLHVIVQGMAEGKAARKIRINTEKLEKLGWKPEIGLEEGFKRLVRSEEEKAAERFGMEEEE